MSKQTIEGGKEMASNSVLESENRAAIKDAKRLRDLIVSKIVENGCACSTDLETLIGGGTKAADFLEPLSELEKSGILRRMKDKSDPRKYNEYQIVYELAR